MRGHDVDVTKDHPPLPVDPVGGGRPEHIQRAINAARNRANDIRNRRAVIAQVLELIPPPIRLGKVALIRGAGDTWHLRTDKGKNLGEIRDRALAQFVLDAPEHLHELSAYVGELEERAFQAREERRDEQAQQSRRDLLLQQITDELLAADELGAHTKDGQRRVRSAISAAKREDEDRFDRRRQGRRW